MSPGLRKPLARLLRTLANALLMAMVVAIPAGAARADTAREYGVKAAYLFNFAKFVTWPDTSFPAAQDPIRICVLGRDDFGGTLDAVVKGKTVRGRKLEVQKLRGAGDDDPLARSCHILFISASEQGREAVIFAAIEDRSIVTVGEVEGFATKGGMFNYVARGTKVKFQLNRSVAEARGVGVSARLIKLAELVE